MDNKQRVAFTPRLESRGFSATRLIKAKKTEGGMHKRLWEVFSDLQTGYSKYGWILSLGALSAVVGSYLGLVGGGAIVATVSFFYVGGRVEKRMNKVPRKKA